MNTCLHKFRSARVGTRCLVVVSKYNTEDIMPACSDPAPNPADILVYNRGQRSLQTATENIASANTKVKAQLLLDTDPSHTFLTEEVGHQLGLKPTEYREIAMSVFGDSERETKLIR